ncbi:hypothetical protein GQ55_1G131600 [Panicum hallii var. hallii]|uniref:Uncharacterized protein n=1 Tax=Panicum hallii var. hallii TaxID=1504633 RepID=A0A2T7F523_9POAL|nr:hypothetical protein GQ55_1G131600 [Panicum hallii var. hallii]
MIFGFDLGPMDCCAAWEQKMERERQEKLKKKLEYEKADANKTKPADSDKLRYHRSLSRRDQTRIGIVLY